MSSRTYTQRPSRTTQAPNNHRTPVQQNNRRTQQQQHQQQQQQQHHQQQPQRQPEAGIGFHRIAPDQQRRNNLLQTRQRGAAQVRQHQERTRAQGPRYQVPRGGVRLGNDNSVPGPSRAANPLVHRARTLERDAQLKPVRDAEARKAREQVKREKEEKANQDRKRKARETANRNKEKVSAKEEAERERQRAIVRAKWANS